MSESLRNVKKEIRILGLDACNPKILIGAIVRGGLYLDGVLAFPLKNNSVELAREITETKYFPELRVIMIHDPIHRLNSRVIQRITAMPLIQVPLGTKTKVGNRETLGNKSSRDRRGTVLHPSVLRRILALTQGREVLPEPARIAHLLAKLHVLGPLLRDKR
jgi:endonuclease V-like protein UPF0215 family